jgi:hypothetical protein
MPLQLAATFKCFIYGITGTRRRKETTYRYY